MEGPADRADGPGCPGWLRGGNRQQPDDPGKINLWASDHYHASNAGYYLHALVVFGMVTGADPRALGGGERAAAALGLSQATAVALQNVAFAQVSAVPEPGTWLLLTMGGGLLAWQGRRRSSASAVA